MITLVIGGGRSGKSLFAEGLAEKHGKKIVYLATAVPFDDEMKERIEKHQSRRGESWKTVNMYHLFEEVRGHEALFESNCILLDSLGMMVNNVMFHCGIGFEQETAQSRAQAEKQALQALDEVVEFCRHNGKELILVSEEVGMGIVPESAMTRFYRDLLGLINQRAAAIASQVYFVVAGISTQIK